MNESQVRDFCKVLSEEKMTNFFITDVKRGEAIISIYGVQDEVGDMIATAIDNNEQVEKLISTALLGVLAKRSSDPKKTVLDFLKVLSESK